MLLAAFSGELRGAGSLVARAAWWDDDDDALELLVVSTQEQYLTLLGAQACTCMHAHSRALL